MTNGIGHKKKPTPLLIPSSMTSVYLRTIMTQNRPATPQIYARLLPFSPSDPHSIEYWEPGKVFITLPYSSRLSSDRMYGHDVVFGASDGESVFMIGYSLSGGHKKNVDVMRDGGTMEVTVGVPTVPGDNLTHLFAVLGYNILTPAMLASTKRMLKLTHPQVLRIFRDQPTDAFRYIAEAHSRRHAMSRLRRVRRRRRQQ